MTSATMIIFPILLIAALTSLIYSELVNVLSVPHYQLARGNEIAPSDSLIHKYAIPKVASIGLNQADSNVMSIGSDRDVGNQSTLAAELIGDLVESNLEQAANVLLVSSSDSI